jgi:hypothetical protein
MKCYSCDNEAKWFPVMLFYAPRVEYPKAPPARAVCAIPTCDAHRALRTVYELLTDDGFATVCRMFRAQSKVLPDRSLTEVTFIEIDSREAQGFRASLNRVAN